MTGTGQRDRGRAARAVTLAQVAKEAGVSPATASFALSGRAGGGPSGSAQTRRRVQEAADRLGYVPNRYARAMRTGRSNAVVLALGTVGDPWGISLTRAVRDLALPHELATVVLADERWFEFLSGYASDCAFVTSVDSTPGGADQVRRLARSGIEVVAFSELLEPDGFDVIASSAEAAVREAYALLAGRHPRVSFLGVPTAAGDGTRLIPSRAQAFREAALGADDPLSAASVREVGRGHGRSLEECRAWLAGPERPTAVVCSTGYLALALQAAAAAQGIRVPEELEIVAIGDVPEDAQFLAPISYYGVQDVFARIARIIIDRAVHPGGGGPGSGEAGGTRHEFTWQLFPGRTTRELPA